MTFFDAAKELKITNFPAELGDIYENIEKTGEAPFSREMIVSLQEEFDLFGEYYEDVLQGFEDLKRDKARDVWAKAVSAYALTHSREELKKIEQPQSDMTPAGQMAPLFPLMVRAKGAYQEYLRRGFSEEEARGYLRTYRNSIGVGVARTGKPGLIKTYFDWSSLYAFTEIFNIGGFNFAIGNVEETTLVLQNKKTKELKVLLDKTVFHKDGMALGTAGFLEEEGKYLVTFEETDTHYIGFPAEERVCPNQKTFFSKEEWRLALAPGDDIFVLHIPKGTNLAPDKVAEAFRLARQVAEKGYPERNIKGIRCTSWLLEPKFYELLGENSNIVRFGALFTRYPFKNGGKGIFSFAFGGAKPDDISSLPEDTTLQRKVKKLYLDGGYIYSYGGFIIDKDE